MVFRRGRCRNRIQRGLVLPNPDVNKAVFHFYRVSPDRTFVVIQAFPAPQGKGLFMKGTCYLWFTGRGSDHSTAQGHLFPVRAFVLGGVPFIPSREIEESDLFIPVFDAYAAIFCSILHAACRKPVCSLFIHHLVVSKGFLI